MPKDSAPKKMNGSEQLVPGEYSRTPVAAPESPRPSETKWEEDILDERHAFKVADARKLGLGSYIEHSFDAAALPDAQEFKAVSWKVCIARSKYGPSVRIFFTGDPDARRSELAGVVKLHHEVRLTVGNPYTVEPSQESNIFLLPKRGRYTRPCAQGNRVFISEDDPSWWCDLAHEETHGWTRQLYGQTHLSCLDEGTAVYYSRRRFPAANKAATANLPLYEDVLRAMTGAAASGERDIPLTHTRLLKTVEPLRADLVEYTYPLGTLFVEYFIGRYGNKEFHDLYRNTCVFGGEGRTLLNLYDRNTGKPLVVNGQKAADVHQTEILEAAIRRVGKDPDVIKQEFGDYVRKKAAEAKGA
jgi:hypothetical protein